MRPPPAHRARSRVIGVVTPLSSRKISCPARSRGYARRTPRAACGWLPYRPRWRGVTFFEPQTHFAQQVPDLRKAQPHRSLAAQLVLNLGQGQVRLGLNPDQNLPLCLGSSVRLAPGAMRHPLRLPGTVSLRGDLLRPTHTDQKTLSQLFKRGLAFVVGRKKLTAQIIAIGSSHVFCVAECRQLQSILFPKML